MTGDNVKVRMQWAVAALILALAPGCSKPGKKEAETAAPVQTAAVERGQIQRIIQAQAIIYPIDKAAIMSKISAPVRKFYVDRGDSVRKGQLLAELENRDLAAADLEAKGNLEQAEANYRSTMAAALPEEMAKAQADAQSTRESLDAAQKLYENRKALFEEGALPRKQLDEAQVAYVQARSRYEIAARRLESLQKVDKETQAQAAQAQLEAARGRRKVAEAQLAYSRITSPIDGVVTDRPLYAGETAGPGTLLMTVMNLSRIIARASVPAHQLRFIKAGNSAVIRSPDGSVRVQGKVTVVSPALNPASTTAEIWVLAENSGRRLKPGYAVHVYISSERIPDAIVIPASALQPAQKGAGDSVLVVGPDSLAHARSVDIGIRESDHVQVLRGVNPGEQVITVGGFGLRDNAKVKIINPDGKKTEQQ